jgi:D-lactate dehydrogenase (cytochrome)
MRRFAGGPQVVADSIAQAKLAAEAHGGLSFGTATTQAEMDSIWAARKEALWANVAVAPKGTVFWGTDVAVPLSKLAELIEESKARARELGLFTGILGHVGDGNFHQSIFYHPESAEERKMVEQCVERMNLRALELEGTVSVSLYSPDADNNKY